MKTIPVAACGDDWVNPQEVEQMIAGTNPGEAVVLDLRSEGPSLHALGVVSAVTNWCQQHGIDHRAVTVTNWSNSVEAVPFQRSNQHLLSHFFWLSEQYQYSAPETRTGQYLFGYFVGRRTVPRCVILQQVQQNFASKFLLSMMSTVADFKFYSLDPLETWADPEQFYHWWNSVSIPSLDRCAVRDQYQGQIDTNASLLSLCYHVFDIELAAETYTHGNVFFPTEKTVRPIVGNKSLLVYGPQNYLARLRDLGFRTWHDIWDEGYDQFTGVERWQRMQLVIADLCTRDQTQLWQQCQAITQHNRTHLDQLVAKYKPL